MIRPKRSEIQALSATALATMASFVAIYLDPFMKDASALEKWVYTAIGIPLLYSVFRVSETILRRLYYRDVLGEWYYATRASYSPQKDNFALMTFDFDDDGVLQYHVELYPSLDDLQHRRNSRGRAISEALEYNPRTREFHILYNVNLYEDGLQRRGRLYLHLEESKTLRGEWSSVVLQGPRSEVSRGEMLAAREKAFPEIYQAWHSATGPQANLPQGNT